MNTRFSTAAALTVGALAACAPTPLPLATAPGPVGEDAVASAAPSPTANVTATPLPAKSSAPGVAADTVDHRRPWIPASAPAPGGFWAILRGHVYDESGAPVDQAYITIRSLDPTVPYSATVATDQGSWVVNSVPDGVNVELIATKTGWTGRRRVGAFEGRSTGSGNIVNFGAAGLGHDSGAEDPDGEAYFLSNYPDIVDTAPAPSSSDPAGDHAYMLTLSEPLDLDNRDRFADALRVFPANVDAVPGPLDAADRVITAASYLDLSEVRDVLPLQPFSQSDHQMAPAGGNWAYAIDRDSLFGEVLASKSSVTWNESGDQATFHLPIPLQTARSGRARYQIGLVAGQERITDNANNQLGTDRLNQHAVYPTAGMLIHNVFRHEGSPIPPSPETGDTRWAAIHRMTSTRELPRDERPPQLIAADVSTIGRDTRITFTFDEPLAAFDGRIGGHRAPQLGFVATGDPAQPGPAGGDDPLSGFTFAVGERRGDTAGVDLPGRSSTDIRRIDPTQTGRVIGGVSDDMETALRFAPAALAATPRRSELDAGSDEGRITFELDPRDPRNLYLYVFGRPQLFSPDLAELKLRVEGLADPAGNTITAGDADRATVTLGI